MKAIKDILKESILKEANSSVEITDYSFYASIINMKDGKLNQRLINLILLSVVIIASASFLICSAIFFLNDVILFKGDLKMNQQGAIVFEKSGKKETILYLLNSADVWSNTGIQLQEGDKIRLSFSGGFHSDAPRLKDAAENNYKPVYDWINYPYSTENQTVNDTVLGFCLYKSNNKENKAYFGSMLYQIAGEMGCDINNPNAIHQIKKIEKKKDKPEYMKVHKNGILYLSVNDILMTDDVIDSISNYNYSCEKYKGHRKTGNDGVSHYVNSDALDMRNNDLLIYYKEDSLHHYIAGKKFKEHFAKNRNAFFNDNIGEILVTIDIERKLKSTGLTTPTNYFYHGLERIFD